MNIAQHAILPLRNSLVIIERLWDRVVFFVMKSVKRIVVVIAINKSILVTNN